MSECSLERLVDREQEVVTDQLEEGAHRGVGAENDEPASTPPELLDRVQQDPEPGGVDEAHVRKVDQQARSALPDQLVERLLQLLGSRDVDLTDKVHTRDAAVEIAGL